MKARSLLIVAVVLSICTYSNAQQIPNAGFENWTSQTTYSNPDNWQTPNESVSGMSQIVVEEYTDNPFEGSKSCYLETKNVGFFNQQGVVTLGTYTSVPFQGAYITGGIPFTDKPSKIKFQYMSDPVAGDNVFVGIYFMKDGNVIAESIFTNDQKVDSWTEVELDITFNSSEQPDTFNIIASSSNYNLVGGFMELGDEGSKLWLDAFTFDVNAIENQVISDDLLIFPNPFSSGFNIEFTNQTTENIEVQLINPAGKILYETYLAAYENEIEIEINEIPSGIYFVRFTNGTETITKQVIKH